MMRSGCGRVRRARRSCARRAGGDHAAPQLRISPPMLSQHHRIVVDEDNELSLHVSRPGFGATAGASTIFAGVVAKVPLRRSGNLLRSSRPIRSDGPEGGSRRFDDRKSKAEPEPPVRVRTRELVKLGGDVLR